MAVLSGAGRSIERILRPLAMPSLPTSRVPPSPARPALSSKATQEPFKATAGRRGKCPSSVCVSCPGAGEDKRGEVSSSGREDATDHPRFCLRWPTDTLDRADQKAHQYEGGLKARSTLQLGSEDVGMTEGESRASEGHDHCGGGEVERAKLTVPSPYCPSSRARTPMRRSAHGSRQPSPSALVRHRPRPRTGRGSRALQQSRPHQSVQADPSRHHHRSRYQHAWRRELDREPSSSSGIPSNGTRTTTAPPDRHRTLRTPLVISAGRSTDIGRASSADRRVAARSESPMRLWWCWADEELSARVPLSRTSSVSTLSTLGLRSMVGSKS